MTGTIRTLLTKKRYGSAITVRIAYFFAPPTCYDAYYVRYVPYFVDNNSGTFLTERYESSSIYFSWRWLFLVWSVLEHHNMVKRYKMLTFPVFWRTNHPNRYGYWGTVGICSTLTAQVGTSYLLHWIVLQRPSFFGTIRPIRYARTAFFLLVYCPHFSKFNVYKLLRGHANDPAPPRLKKIELI